METKPRYRALQGKKFSCRRLVEARAERRREEIAVAAGVATDTVRRWELGKAEPDASKLAAIAAFTGKPLDFFFEKVA
jgi:transcriptional regulator with XRE-family HTH domain